MYSIILTAIAAFITCMVLTPPLRAVLQRAGFVDRHEQRNGGAPIARMGGVAVLLAAGAGAMAPYILGLHAVANLNAALPMLRLLVGPVVLILVLGVTDDAFGLSPQFKLIIQLVAAFWLVHNGLEVDTVLGHPLPAGVATMVTMVWLLGCTNAFNLIDGLDGLATGVAIFSTGTVMTFALVNHFFPLALLAAALCAALIAFLHFNFYPASIFLGDAGSLPIGFLLGAFGLLWMDKTTTLVGLTAPLFALAVPLLDTGLAVSRRWLSNRPIFGRDHGHIHHRLIQRGLTVNRSVVVLYGVALVGASASLVLSSVRHQRYSGIVILAIAVLVWGGVQQLGYTEFAEALRIWRRGFFDQRKIIRSLVYLQSLLPAFSAAKSVDELWQQLGNVMVRFRFTAVELRVGSRDSVRWHRRGSRVDDPAPRLSDQEWMPITAAHPPKGWSLIIPLGSQGELGHVCFWRSGPDRFPIPAQHLVDVLAPALTAQTARLLESDLAQRTAAAAAGAGADSPQPVTGSWPEAPLSEETN